MSDLKIGEPKTIQDHQLLHEYIATRSRNALGELIRRHLALVYSSALRQVRDSHLAEDVTQAVFLVLSEKAGTIRSGVALGGWLLTVTRCASVNAMKKQTIQKKHESLAARPEKINAAAEGPGFQDEWRQIEPLLDEELNRLAVVDRDAIVLRFFQDRSFAQIGAELGISEDAARKRVGRSLERLRSAIRRREPSISLASLGGAMAIHAVQAAPGHVMAGTIAAGIGSPSSQSLTIAKGTTKMIAWAKAKLVSTVAASLMAGGAGAVVITHAMSHRPAPAPSAVVEYSAPTATPAPIAEAPPAPTNDSGTAINPDASPPTPPVIADAPADNAAPAAVPLRSFSGAGGTSGVMTFNSGILTVPNTDNSTGNGPVVNPQQPPSVNGGVLVPPQ